MCVRILGIDVERKKLQAQAAAKKAAIAQEAQIKQVITDDMRFASLNSLDKLKELRETMRNAAAHDVYVPRDVHESPRLHHEQIEQQPSPGLQQQTSQDASPQLWQQSMPISHRSDAYHPEYLQSDPLLEMYETVARQQQQQQRQLYQQPQLAQQQQLLPQSRQELQQQQQQSYGQQYPPSSSHLNYGQTHEMEKGSYPAPTAPQTQTQQYHHHHQSHHQRQTNREPHHHSQQHQQHHRQHTHSHQETSAPISKASTHHSRSEHRSHPSSHDQGSHAASVTGSVTASTAPVTAAGDGNTQPTPLQAILQSLKPPSPRPNNSRRFSIGDDDWDDSSAFTPTSPKPSPLVSGRKHLATSVKASPARTNHTHHHEIVAPAKTSPSKPVAVTSTTTTAVVGSDVRKTTVTITAPLAAQQQQQLQQKEQQQKEQQQQPSTASTPVLPPATATATTSTTSVRSKSPVPGQIAATPSAPPSKTSTPAPTPPPVHPPPPAPPASSAGAANSALPSPSAVTGRKQAFSFSSTPDKQTPSNASKTVPPVAEVKKESTTGAQPQAKQTAPAPIATTTAAAATTTTAANANTATTPSASVASAPAVGATPASAPIASSNSSIANNHTGSATPGKKATPNTPSAASSTPPPPAVSETKSSKLYISDVAESVVSDLDDDLDEDDQGNVEEEDDTSAYDEHIQPHHRQYQPHQHQHQHHRQPGRQPQQHQQQHLHQQQQSRRRLPSADDEVDLSGSWQRSAYQHSATSTSGQKKSSISKQPTPSYRFPQDNHVNEAAVAAQYAYLQAEMASLRQRHPAAHLPPLTSVTAPNYASGYASNYVSSDKPHLYSSMAPTSSARHIGAPVGVPTYDRFATDHYGKSASSIGGGGRGSGKSEIHSHNQYPPGAGSTTLYPQDPTSQTQIPQLHRQPASQQPPIYGTGLDTLRDSVDLSGLSLQVCVSVSIS